MPRIEKLDDDSLVASPNYMQVYKVSAEFNKASTKNRHEEDKTTKAIESARKKVQALKSPFDILKRQTSHTKT